MTEKEWGVCLDPYAMLTFLDPANEKIVKRRQWPSSHRWTDRCLRFFSVACAYQSKMKDLNAWVGWADYPEQYQAGYMSGEIAAYYWCGKQTGQHPGLRLSTGERMFRANLMRCIFGNPFRPFILAKDDPKCPYCSAKWWYMVEPNVMYCRQCQRTWDWPKDPYQYLWLTPTVKLLTKQASEGTTKVHCEKCLHTGRISKQVRHDQKGKCQFCGTDLFLRTDTGNPFWQCRACGGVPVEFDYEDCSHCSGRGHTTTGTLDPLTLTALADALEEAGCDNEDALRHLRETGPHYPGCHAVDALLQRE